MRLVGVPPRGVRQDHDTRPRAAITRSPPPRGLVVVQVGVGQAGVERTCTPSAVAARIASAARVAASPRVPVSPA